MKYVTWFDEETAIDVERAGGKGESLARLVDAGFAVPDGFCVTTDAFREFVDESDVGSPIETLSDIDPGDVSTITSRGAEIRSRLRERELPADVTRAIEDALASERFGESYAVRSSATAEDRPTMSFAGQHETFLNVPREAVVDRVRDCMVSLFTDRAIAYRLRNEVPQTEAAMAVVVQRFVDADAAGVLFTADPESGNRHIATIDASYGLGEAVVGGDIVPDSAKVDKRTKTVIEYRVGHKEFATRPRDDAAGVGGTETVTVPPDRRTGRSLSDDEVITLVDTGVRIETVLGGPQDVEWALVDGTFVILQARPITSLFPLPTPPPEDGRLHVYLSVGHLQAFPEAMPPLVRDIWLSFMRSEAEAFGMESGSELGVEAGGRIFIDVTNALRVGLLRRRIPGRIAAVSEPAAIGLEDVIDRREAAFRGVGSSGTRVLSRLRWLLTVSEVVLPVVLPTIRSFLGAFFGEPTPPRRKEAWFVAWGRRKAQTVVDGETPSDRVRAVFDSMDVRAIIREVYPQIGPLFAAFVAGGWIDRRFPDAREDVDAVGRGFHDELVTRINLGLGDLADIARDHPSVVDALRANRDLEAISSVEGGARFGAAFEAFLDEFGHRATGELDISRPRWCEDPSPLLSVVRANLVREGAEGHRERIDRLAGSAEAAADRLVRRADRGFLGPIRGLIVRRMIRTYRGYIQMREYPKQGVAFLFAAWREVLLDAGERLAAAGDIDRPDDVWFLRREELVAAMDGEPIAVDIRARRLEFRRVMDVDAPPVMTSEGEIPRTGRVRDDVPPGALVGTGVSSGVVEGIARVIRDPTTATIEPGEVLVAPSSDPGWTPLFLNAAAMVVEVGGPVSHGALVAREYGLPAVVSVPGATHGIRTGQRVRVDGTRGIVEILDGETELEPTE